MIIINILILNIGSNPLPNYVVANYLLNSSRNDIDKMPVPNKLILVHSSITEKHAKEIIRILKVPDKIVEYSNLGVKERDGKFISEIIRSTLEKYHQQISTIHLNYTGGTKPMAVHAYQAVKDYGNVYSTVETIFSDLNHKSFKIIIDNGGDEYPDDGDLRDYVELSIKQIFEMHLMKFKESKNTTLYKDLGVFQKLIDKGFTEENNRLKPNFNVRNIMDEINDKMKNFKKENYEDRFNHIYSVLSQVIKPFKDYSQKEFKELIAWLDGVWLEEYVLLTIQQLAKEFKLTEVKTSVKAIKSAQEPKENRECEIDVVVMKGYQLYVISCTTSRELAKIKNKAFEAIYRGEQLGGEHTKVIMVTTMREKKKRSRVPNNKQYALEDIDKDLSSFDATENKKVETIGLETIKHPERLQQKLRDIFAK